MQVSLALPGRLRLPYRLRRKVTAFLWSWFDSLVFDLHGTWLFPQENYQEHIGRSSDVIRIWSRIGQIELSQEGVKVLNTGVSTVRWATRWFAIEIQVEDWQERSKTKHDNMDTGIYGSHIEIARRRSHDLLRR